MLAAASDAVVLGFNVRPVGDARAAAEAALTKASTRTTVLPSRSKSSFVSSAIMPPSSTPTSCAASPACTT